MRMGGQRHDPAALPPGKIRYPLYRRLVWTSAENSPLPGFDPRTVQPLASRYTDWAIPYQYKGLFNPSFESILKQWMFVTSSYSTWQVAKKKKKKKKKRNKK
jgi:hypothetical protein